MRCVLSLALSIATPWISTHTCGSTMELTFSVLIFGSCCADIIWMANTEWVSLYKHWLGIHWIDAPYYSKLHFWDLIWIRKTSKQNILMAIKEQQRKFSEMSENSFSIWAYNSPGKHLLGWSAGWGRGLGLLPYSQGWTQTWGCTGSWVWGCIHSGRWAGSDPGSGPSALQVSESWGPLQDASVQPITHTHTHTQGNIQSTRHLFGSYRHGMFLKMNSPNWLPSEAHPSSQCGALTQLAAAVPHVLGIVVGWLEALAGGVDPAQLSAVVPHKELSCKWKDAHAMTR